MIRILLAEDSRADVLLVREALKAHGVEYALQLVKDGEEAVRFLTRVGESEDSPCPDVILLDLNLPKVDGTQVLQEFRRHPQCREVPVIVVTSSDMPRDRENAMSLGVTRYFQKPAELEGFLRLGAIIKEVVEQRLA